MKFKDRLILLRKELHLTQEELASKLGFSRTAISAWEIGRNEPSNEDTIKIANFFNVSVDYLLGLDTNNKRLLPVLGTVKAGYNYLAEQNIIDYINPYMEISEPENFFGLLVKGDSMSPKFDDGDYVIVHKTDGCFESGKICVVLINGDEATIKKVIKTEDGIELCAFNPYYPVKKYTFEEIKKLEIKIIGVVENQVRNWK